MAAGINHLIESFFLQIIFLLYMLLDLSLIFFLSTFFFFLKKNKENAFFFSHLLEMKLLPWFNNWGDVVLRLLDPSFHPSTHPSSSSPPSQSSIIWVGCERLDPCGDTCLSMIGAAKSSPIAQDWFTTRVSIRVGHLSTCGWLCGLLE